MFESLFQVNATETPVQGLATTDLFFDLSVEFSYGRQLQTGGWMADLVLHFLGLSTPSISSFISDGPVKMEMTFIIFSPNDFIPVVTN